MQSHKLSACVSPSCVVCKGFGEQVVCVIHMPWTKCLVEMCLFRVAVLTVQRHRWSCSWSWMSLGLLA